MRIRSGIIRNAAKKAAKKSTKGKTSSSGNCGVGKGGFQPGNTCAKGTNGLDRDLILSHWADSGSRMYANISRGITSTTIPESGRKIKYSKEQIAEGKFLIKLVQSSNTKQKVLYRGTAMSPQELALMKKGKSIEYKELTGTLDNPKTALGFANYEKYGSNRPVVIKHVAKTTHKGLPVDYPGYKGEYHNKSTGKEFILPPKSKFKVSKLTDLKTHVEIEVTE